MRGTNLMDADRSPLRGLLSTILGGILGAVLLVGCTEPFGSPVTVTSPNAEKRGSFGWSTAGLDDVNGDAVSDLAVGAPGEVVKGRPFAGRVYLVSGADGSILETVSSPRPQTKGFFGATTAGIGDLNGDDVGELVVGAHRETVGGTKSAGRIYLVSGADGAILQALSSPNQEQEGYFGTSLAGTGDVNGDDIPEIVVGASDESPQGVPKAGRAYLLSGADGTVLTAFSSPNPEEEGYFGTSVAGLGDASGDGVPDVIVGAYHESGGGGASAGRAYVMSGADGTVVRTLTSPNAQAGGIFGGTVAGLGDVSGDAVPDVVVGAYHESIRDKRRAGRAYVMSGADGSTLQTLTSPNPANTGLFGESIATTSDANADGTPDVLVGAYGEAANGTFGAGRAYLYNGADGSVIATFASPNAEKEGAFGGAVASASSGDGRPRLLIGAFWETIETGREGRSYLFGSAP